jgi:hypothetical protein
MRRGLLLRQAGRQTRHRMIHRGQFLARGNPRGGRTLTNRFESDVDKFWFAIPQTA